MYAWIWRHLPGPTWLRIVLLAAAAIIVVVLLFTVVFPWVTPLLPFSDTTIGTAPIPFRATGTGLTT